MSDWQGRRVLFICNLGPPFTGELYRTAGVGGTEAAIVLLAEAFAARGASVVVANRVETATVDGAVRYVPLATLEAETSDLVVLWKQWSDAAAGQRGRKLFFWTDVHIMPAANLPRCREWADVSCTLSAFAYKHLKAATGDARLVSLGGGPIDTPDYMIEPLKSERLLLYCSVPDRGLYHLKDLFPRIRRRVPDARLVITSDFTLWGAQPAKAAFRRFFDEGDSVEYVGHVSRAELVAWQRRARVMAYPCHFEEGFCLSAAECMAAGAVPVTTGRYALVETVGDGGVLIPGHPRSWLYRRRFVRACVELLTDEARRRCYVERGRARALDHFAPAHVVDRLLHAAGMTTPG